MTDAWFAALVLVGFSGCQQQPTGKSPTTAPVLKNVTSTTAPAAGAATQAGPFHFVDRTTDSGIVWTYRNGFEAERYAIVESLGGGVAAFDYDGDDRDDLFFTGGGKYVGERQLGGLPGGLFRNFGDWRFENVTTFTEINTDRHYSHGAIAGDFDGDGFPDLLVTGYGGLQLWHNQGDGIMREATTEAGLTDSLWSSTAGWGDLNGDGVLDLYVAHYVNWSFENDPPCAGPHPHDREVCPPRSFQPLPHMIYFGQGDGTFRDGTSHAGLRPDGKGLGVLIVDLDLDGDNDVYVGNDTVENFLYENVGDGRLNDVSLLSGTALSDRGVPDGSMGVEVCDFNADGLPDIWVANYEHENCALYQNGGKLLFRHVSQRAGITAVGGMFVGWGTGCIDLDHDGDEDIFVSNGHAIRYPNNSPLRQMALLYENQGQARFRNVAASAGEYMSSPHMGRGAASSDLDGDGDIDLAFAHMNEPVSVLENESAFKGGWLGVDLIGTACTRDPVGAYVVLTTSSGKQFRHYRGGGSYASTHARTLHFGFGTSTIERLEVFWPGGQRQSVESPSANTVIRVVQRAP